MTPYLILVSLLFAALLLLKKVPKGEQNLIFLVLSMILIVFSSMRYGVGKDYFNYLSVFNGDMNTSELGFNLLIDVIKGVGLTYEFLVFVMALFTITLALKFISDNSSSKFFSLIIFFSLGQFYFNTFNSVRQCAVVYIFLNSLIYIEKRSFFKYTISILFATVSFHLTAILLLPLYFIIHKHYSLTIKFIVVIALILLSKFALIIIEYSPYAVYLKFDNFTSDISPTSIILLMITFFLLFFRNNDNKTKDNIHANLNIIALIFMLLLIVFSGTPLIMVVNRLSYYFTPIIIVVLPNVINKLFKQNSRFLVESIISFLLIAICLLALSSNGVNTQMVPYQTIFGSYS